MLPQHAANLIEHYKRLRYASFMSLSFCKIYFSLISGLSAIAFVYAGPVNTDMTVVAVVLGLLAPVISQIPVSVL
jgi:uncharacterized membrane protein (DUF485 family)